VRFNNKIVERKWYPLGNWPCSPIVGAPQKGRPLSMYLHGSDSLPEFDGRADDVLCAAESKDYIYPNPSPFTGWYHDRALGVAAANVYAGGLQGWGAGAGALLSELGPCCRLRLPCMMLHRHLHPGIESYTESAVHSLHCGDCVACFQQQLISRMCMALTMSDVTCGGLLQHSPRLLLIVGVRPLMSLNAISKI
jgi:hypothetical protein